MNNMYLIRWISFLVNGLLCLTAAQGQVQVRLEPRHKTSFENEYVRVLDVHIPPGDTTQYHIHSTASVGIILTNSKVGTAEKSKRGSEGLSQAGHVWYSAYDVHPITHHVWNAGTDTFHVLDIELLRPLRVEGLDLLYIPQLHLLWKEKRVAAYSLDIAANGFLETRAGRQPLLLVAISGHPRVETDGKAVTAGPGKTCWVSPDASFSIHAGPGSASKLVVLQLQQ